MVSIIGHRIHFDGIKVLRGQRHVSEKKNQSKYSPPWKERYQYTIRKILDGRRQTQRLPLGNKTKLSKLIKKKEKLEGGGRTTDWILRVEETSCPALPSVLHTLSGGCPSTQPLSYDTAKLVSPSLSPFAAALLK